MKRTLFLFGVLIIFSLAGCSNMYVGGGVSSASFGTSSSAT